MLAHPGLSYKEIGARYKISPHYFKKLVYVLFDVLGADSRLQLTLVLDEIRTYKRMEASSRKIG